MRIIRARVGGNEYTIGRIRTGLAREAIRVADALPRESSSTPALLRALLEMRDRRSNLVCEAFGWRFDAAALERSCTDAEIEELVGDIVGAVGELAAGSDPPDGGAAASGAGSAEQSMAKLYHLLASKLGWSISLIDEADFENLLAFIHFEDPDVRYIDGQEVHRAKGVPTWL